MSVFEIILWVREFIETAGAGGGADTRISLALISLLFFCFFLRRGSGRKVVFLNTPPKWICYDGVGGQIGCEFFR